MSLTLRASLLIASVLNSIWMIWQIRRARVKIEDTVFWFLFSSVLIILGLFPGIATLGASLLGIQSATNFIFLTIIFILLIKQFRTTIKISVLESKLYTLAQSYAIDQLEKSEQILYGTKELQDLRSDPSDSK